MQVSKQYYMIEFNTHGRQINETNEYLHTQDSGLVYDCTFVLWSLIIELYFHDYLNVGHKTVVYQASPCLCC